MLASPLQFQNNIRGRNNINTEINTNMMQQNDVGEPLPFPAPNLIRGIMRKVFVQVAPDTEPEQRVILHTETNHFYEMGRLLRQSIYGQVQHGYILQINTQLILL